VEDEEEEEDEPVEHTDEKGTEGIDNKIAVDTIKDTNRRNSLIKEKTPRKISI